MNETLKRLSLRRYKVVLRPLNEDDGAGWFAEIPELPGCVSDGDTVEEAMRNVEDAKREWFDYALKKGVPIPEPGKYEEEIFSYNRNFKLRMPRSIYKCLAERAKTEGVSINQLIISFLSVDLGLHGARSEQPTRRPLSVELVRETGPDLNE